MGRMSSFVPVDPLKDALSEIASNSSLMFRSPNAIVYNRSFVCPRGGILPLRGRLVFWTNRITTRVLPAFTGE